MNSARLIWILSSVSVNIVINLSFIECYNLNVVTMNINEPTTLSEYKAKRAAFIEEEKNEALGHDIELNHMELLANVIIMAAKEKEYNLGFKNPFDFAPSRHIFDVLNRINSSDLFKMIKTMPKGGVLHAHDTALCSTDFVLSLTYKPFLWQINNTELNQPMFLFSKIKPTPINGIEWDKVSEIRNKIGSLKYDSYLRSLFTLYTEDPLNAYKDINDVWNRFMHIFILVDPLITYYPNFKSYFKQALKEFQDDGVQYLEFRGTLPTVYDLDGKTFTPIEIVQIYNDVNDEFINENVDFIGSKFIYAPPRKVNDAKIEEYIETMKSIHERFPNFVAGFDLVGQEDKGRPLIEVIEPLLSLPNSINFFFHAGETNWYGTSSDENLIDAILLGTKRIGHGFAILKHPKVLETIKKKQIAIEINPISNQVLKLVDDYRNHPGTALIASNYPVVISSDDPSFWEVSPLSHDFYEAFLGIASKDQDLKLLKKLALNSIIYSAMNVSEQYAALDKWEHNWNKWIEKIISIEENFDNNV